MDVVPVSCSFFMIGYILKINKEKLEKIYTMWLFPIAIIINILFAYFNHLVCQISDLYHAQIGNYFYYMIAAISGIWMTIIISKFIKKQLILEYIGKNTLIYYAFHRSIFIESFGIIAEELSNLGYIFANRYFKVVFIIIFVCIFCGILSYVINKCFPFILGKFPKKKYKMIEGKV